MVAAVEFQPLQPELVKSISEDDEEDDNSPSEGQFVDHSALAYLLRYETMVRQQEAENLASLSHIRPILDRIEELGTAFGEERNEKFAIDEDKVMQREVPFHVLLQALGRLESDTMSSEAMTTDRQFMLVLRTLTKNLTAGTTEEANSQTLTWAEIYQCYKSVVIGMQTLQHLPPSSQARVRARDRSLSMLTLFQPPSTKLLTEDALRTSNNVLTEQPATPGAGRGLFWLLCFALFMIVGTFAAAVAMDPKLAHNLSLPELPEKGELVRAMRSDNLGSVFDGTSIDAPASSSQLAVSTSMTKPRTKAEAATSLAVRVTGVATAPLVIKGIILLPTPLQSLSILSLGGLSLVASVSRAIRHVVEHRRMRKINKL